MIGRALHAGAVAGTASYGAFFAGFSRLALRPTHRARLNERAQRHLAPPRPASQTPENAVDYRSHPPVTVAGGAKAPLWGRLEIRTHTLGQGQGHAQGHAQRTGRPATHATGLARLKPFF